MLLTLILFYEQVDRLTVVNVVLSINAGLSLRNACFSSDACCLGLLLLATAT